MSATTTNLLSVENTTINNDAKDFCELFLNNKGPRYVLGRNEYGISLANEVNIDGFIDDFTDLTEFMGKPLVKMEDVPKNSLVVVAVVGRPFTARKKIKNLGLRNLDYFSFRKYSGLNLKGVWDWDDFENDFKTNRDRYEWVYSLLQDQISKNILTKLVNFRLSSDLRFMDGFEDVQFRQYFEDFLNLKKEDEVFVDVGCFDGHTTLQFIEKCTKYKAIYIFEPDPRNMSVVKSKLSHLPNISYFPLGLSNVEKKVRFLSNGQASSFNVAGDVEIDVAPLDTVLNEKFTLLKMDIEGGELRAIRGARSHIISHHPTLAISVYHRCTDMWKIPLEILSYRKDYKLYLRHYIEGISETVMFFIPR